MDEEEGVKRGARLLDALQPDWYRFVDEERINMTDPTLCIIGQVFGDYRQHQYDVVHGNKEAENLGFLIHANTNVNLVRSEKTSLAYFWIQEIKKRKSA